MPIEHDINSIRAFLDRPENKELAETIKPDLEYLQHQSVGLHRGNKEYLLLLTVQRMIKIFNEFPLMLDGRNNQNNNNNEPF